jgi:hypothetical protein
MNSLRKSPGPQIMGTKHNTVLELLKTAIKLNYLFKINYIRTRKNYKIYLIY